MNQVVRTPGEPPIGQTLEEAVLPQARDPKFVEETKATIKELQRRLSPMIQPDGKTSTHELEGFIEGVVGTLSPEEKQALSAGYALGILKKDGMGTLPVNAELTRLTQALVDQITVGTKAEGVEVLVVEAPTHEGFVMDSDTIVVSAKFAEQLSEGAFKGLLKHEIGHIEGEHVYGELLARIYASSDAPGDELEQNRAVLAYKRAREFDADRRAPDSVAEFIKSLKRLGLGDTDGKGTHPTDEERLERLSPSTLASQPPPSPEFSALQAAASRVEKESRQAREQEIQAREQANVLGGIGKINREHPLTPEQQQDILTLAGWITSVSMALNTGEAGPIIRKITTAGIGRSEFFDHMRFGLSFSAQVEALRVAEPIKELEVDNRSGEANYVNSSGSRVSIPQNYERLTPSGRLVSRIHKDGEGNAYRSLVFHPNEPTSKEEVLQILGLDSDKDEPRLLGGLSGIITHQQMPDGR